MAASARWHDARFEMCMPATASAPHRTPRHKLPRSWHPAKKIQIPKHPPADPVKAASAVALKYVNDESPGIRRKRAGSGFNYISAQGKPVRDEETLRRIKALVIPPAWTEVWICPSADGHLQ